MNQSNNHEEQFNRLPKVVPVVINSTKPISDRKPETSPVKNASAQKIEKIENNDIEEDSVKKQSAEKHQDINVVKKTVAAEKNKKLFEVEASKKRKAVLLEDHKPEANLLEKNIIASNEKDALSSAPKTTNDCSKNQTASQDSLSTNEKIGSSQDADSETSLLKEREVIPKQQDEILFENPVRPNDHGFGRPLVKPRFVEVVEGSGVSNDMNEPIIPDSKSNVNERLEIWAPYFLRSAVFVLLLALVSLLVFIPLTRSLWTLMLQITQLPKSWMIWAAGLSYSYIVGLILFYVFKVVCFIARLRYKPQVVVSQIGFSSFDAKQAALARREFTKHLVELNADFAQWSKSLSELNMKDDQLLYLKKSINDLLESRPIDANNWWNECEENFLEPLDALAKARLNRAIKAIGLKTAISPWKAVDTVVVVHHSFHMAKDLCAIANLRPGKFGTISIMLHVAVNVYVASQVQAWSEQGAQILGDVNEEIMAEMGMDFAGSMIVEGAGSVVKLITPKIAEGLVNSMFAYRLGSRVWKLVRPVKLS
jgi:uncharacterized membrane protein YcjF (UPF0283 family)